MVSEGNSSSFHHQRSDLHSVLGVAFFWTMLLRVFLHVHSLESVFACWKGLGRGFHLVESLKYLSGPRAGARCLCQVAR